MASRSINKVVLLGNLTRDPELKYTPTGAAVCTFSVATNRTWTTAEGQTKEDVQYHRVTAWNKLAELCGKLLTKGRKVYLEGRITYRNYTGKDGVQRSVTEIVLDDFIVFSDGRRTGEMGDGTSTDHHTEPAHSQTESESHAPSTPTPDTSSSSHSDDESINPDDIPF